MSNKESPVVIGDDKVLLPRGRGGEKEKENNTSNKIKHKTKVNDYSKDLQSRFGRAFLPYAAQLESVERERTFRKRKGKNKRKQPVKITILPTYKNNNKRKGGLYDEIRRQNGEKISRKRIIATKRNEKATTNLAWSGDTMTFDDEWPNVESRKTIRIFHINLNGVTSHNNYLEWEMTIAFLMDMQVDVFGLTEINLDLNNGIIKDKFVQSGKHFDNYLRMATSSSLQKVGDTPFKMGGTVTGTNGVWSGRITEQGCDVMGRWSFLKLQTRYGKEVVFITTYLPRKPSKEGGGSTIYNQMAADLLKRKGKLLDPRKELLADLYIYIEKENKKGNTLFLMGDMNDNLGLNDSQVNKFLQSLGMTIAHKVRHGDNEPLPATHDRGTTCLDLIGCSDHVNESAIVRAGFAPFYFNFFTDHRGVFIDLDIKSIFHCPRPDTTKAIYKRFTTLHVPKCSKYLHKLEELMEGSRIGQQVDELERQYNDHADGKKGDCKEAIIKKTKELFKKVTEFMICAERSAGPKPYKDGFPDSPQLRRIAFRVIRIKKYLRLVSLGNIIAEKEETDKVAGELKQAQLDLRGAQKNANIIRQEHLERLADKRCHQWQMTSAEALHIINESEKSKRLHGKHRRLLRKDNEGTLRSLLVPAPTSGLKNNVKDARLYTNVTDSNQMFNILLQRNFNHLVQSNDSMFTKGTMLDRCGWHGNDEGMESVLQGLLNEDEIKKDYPQYGTEGVEFLKALRYKRDKNGELVSPFSWKFGAEEFIALFNKTRESTACGPSGLHMSHWKAACERKDIARIHAFFMWAAFEWGFTYERWEQSWHCMIKKLKKPFLPKLRIVQLFEGDFNAGLKYLIGKRMMQHMNEKDLHDPETFGSRTGKTAPEALINLQLLFDHSRVWKLPAAIIFNDAIGCYDRIVPTLCDLAMRARGCPKGIAKCHTLTQKGMIHRIRISTGISDGMIRFSETSQKVYDGNKLMCIQGKTGGIGQGGGAGPLSWIAIIDVMLEAYRNICPGANAIDPMMLYTMCYWLISYVDDNTIVAGFKDGTNQNTIMDTLQKNLSSWRRLLQLTGGDIDVIKSKWCVMRWRYSKDWGEATMETKKEFPGKLGLDSEQVGIISTQYLERLEPSQAERVLGVRVPMDGNMNEEYNFRKSQIRDLSKKIQGAPINHWDAWMIYESRYRAIIRYPLPVTMFTMEQCHDIQKPFINALLPKLGLNRNTARVVIYGPKEYGGLELMDLRTEQVVNQWETTSGHLRRMDRAGKGLHITANDLQVESGSQYPFFTLNPEKCNYTTKGTRWAYIWEIMFKLGLSIEMYQFWVPPPKYENDRNIMDEAMRDDTLINSKWDMIKHVNTCRLYIKAFYISDLTIDGRTVHVPFLDGTQRLTPEHMEIPDVRRPSQLQWNIWKSFLYRNFLSPGTNINPPLTNEKDNRTPPKLPVSEIDLMFVSTSGNESVRDMLLQLPPSLKNMVGKCAIPDDDGLSISESIVAGRCMGASDGSLLRSYSRTIGSHGFALRDMDREQMGIDGWGLSPSSDDMSSMTTEHYGLLGIIILLHVLCRKYQLTEDECFDAVVIVIDNKTVVSRANEAQTLVNLSDYAVPDQDLWAMTTELITKLPIRVSIEWVKGHQDVNSFGEKINGPFSREVMMNVLVDKLAKRGMDEGEGMQVKKHTLSTAAISLHDKNSVQIKNLRKYMLRERNGAAMLQYHMERKDWSKELLGEIEWEGIDSMMRGASPLRRTKLVKLLNDWQNIGSQKRKIRDSRLKVDSDNPEEATSEERLCHLCPDGCNEEEKILHYLECPANHAIERRRASIVTVLRRLKKLRTYEGITSMIGHILNKISKREDMDFEWEYLHLDGDMSMIMALTGQEKIGWTRLCQGYYHKEWSTIQARHYRRIGLNTRTHNIKRWKKMFSTILADYCLEGWQMRNETLHGKERVTNRRIQLESIRKKIKDAYTKKESMRGDPNFKIFDMPSNKRLQMGIQSSTIWVGMAEEAIRLNRENAIKNTIDHWLNP